jgi:hypothetical protein
VYRWGSRRWHSFSLGLHTTVVYAEIYAIKAKCNGECKKGYKGGASTVFLTVKQPLRLNNSQKNSKLFWHCHQSLVKLAEHKTIQQVCVLGHIGIDVKK